MIGAGLVAKKANERGLKTKPWVKSSLAPGSRVVTEYLDKSDLSKELDMLNKYLVLRLMPFPSPFSTLRWSWLLTDLKHGKS